MTEIRLYRDGVADSLRRLDEVELVETAATGPAAVMTVRRTNCDVVLLDMALRDSTQVVAALLTARPALKVMALGVPEDSTEVVECAEAGICGYVSREATLAEVGEALHSALRGEAAVTPKLAARLLRHIAFQARSRRGGEVPQQLTPRERQVMQLLENGMTNRQIARALDLEVSTVKNHVHNLLAKCGVAARGDVVAACGRAQLAADGERSEIQNPGPLPAVTTRLKRAD
ncbi:response regulator transcription factor [Mycobacterium sp. ACS1612]|uniref:LuxR C-terminal-related transcriptional regulator n=1 Tax=Mycobacterium sp. ACS1612 TaxID=1834117 RepID=UPI0018D4ABC1|nr:response regulator transcription factor [Mycobacterium sp. ACS1612]